MRFESCSQFILTFPFLRCITTIKESITYREEIDENARQLKAKAYSRKDFAGRSLSERFGFRSFSRARLGSVMKGMNS